MDLSRNISSKTTRLAVTNYQSSTVITHLQVVCSRILVSQLLTAALLRKKHMGIQSLGLIQPEQRNILDNPSIPLSSPAAWEWLDGGRESDALEVVSPATSMGQATVNACVRLLSESIASMNPILYERSGTGKVEAFDHPLHKILSLEPCPDSTAFSMWDSFVASIALWGNGYLEVTRDGVNNVTGLWFLQPTSVTPQRQADGSLSYRVTQGMAAGQFRLLKPKQIIHVPWHSVDGVTGVSVIAQARNVIGGAIAMDKFGNRFFANNATPSGILTMPATMKAKPEEKPKMRADWEMQQRGNNQHRVNILDGGMTFTPITIPNNDAQWIESQNLSRQMICGLFKIMPSMIGDTARVAGETYAAQQLSFLTHTLRPWLNRISQELTRKLLVGLPQYSIVHDVSDMLKTDFKTQMDGFAASRQWGLMTSNQCREALGLNPGGPECDVYLSPANMIDSRRLLDPPKPDATEGTENV